MKGFLWTLFALVFCACAHAENSNRLLLRPPEKMPSTVINGKEYVRGDVYLSKNLDPVILKPLGFREVTFVVSEYRYNCYHALWPRKLELDSLPSEIVGFRYDYTPETGDNSTFYRNYNTGSCTSDRVEYNGKVIKPESARAGCRRCR